MKTTRNNRIKMELESRNVYFFLFLFSEGDFLFTEMRHETISFYYL